MTPEVSRRQFLKAVGASALGTVVFAGCSFPKTELMVESPSRMPEDIVTGTDNWYATLCRMCPAGCGIIVRVMEGRAKKIEGNPLYPVNRGKLCAKGQAGLQLLYHPDRLMRPLFRERLDEGLQEITWDEALDRLAGKLRELRKEPAGVMIATEPLRAHQQSMLTKFLSFYSWPSHGGAQHLAYESLESASLRKGFASLQASSNGGMLPLYDISNSSFILSFGSDILSAGPSAVQYSLAYGEFRQGDRPRGTLVQIEPRFSVTAANADRWVPVKPGTEGILALSMAYVILHEGIGDPGSANVLTDGRGAEALKDFDPGTVSSVTGVSSETIVNLARQLADTKPALAIPGEFSAAQTNGMFNVSAVLALNYLVGSIGRPGGLIMNPMPPADLPVAYSATPLSRWKQILEQVRTGTPQAVRLLMIHGVNPIFGMPGDIRVEEALRQVPMIVSVSSFLDETAAMAHLVLPEHTYLEDWGDDLPDPGPGFQVLGLQQPVVAPVGDTRGVSDIFLELARRLGAPQDLPQEMSLPWDSFRDLLRHGAREIHNLDRGSVTDESFEQFWVKALQQGGWWDVSASFDGKLSGAALLPSPAVEPKFSGDPLVYPLHLVPFASNSIGDGRWAHLPWLQATPDPITTVVWSTSVEIGEDLGRQLGLIEGDVVLVESPVGSLSAQVYVNPALPNWVVVMPMGQGHKTGSYAGGRGSNVFSIISSLEDENTGSLAWGATMVRLSKTGSKMAIPKFEGTVFPVQVEGSEVVKVTG